MLLIQPSVKDKRRFFSSPPDLYFLWVVIKCITTLKILIKCNLDFLTNKKNKNRTKNLFYSKCRRHILLIFNSLFFYILLRNLIPCPASDHFFLKDVDSKHLSKCWLSRKYWSVSHSRICYSLTNTLFTFYSHYCFRSSKRTCSTLLLKTILVQKNRSSWQLSVQIAKSYFLKICDANNCQVMNFGGLLSQRYKSFKNLTSE